MEVECPYILLTGSLVDVKLSRLLNLLAFILLNYKINQYRIHAHDYTIQSYRHIFDFLQWPYVSATYY
jgi:hypothetical protein